jgi:hypothetical protein
VFADRQGEPTDDLYVVPTTWIATAGPCLLSNQL